MSHSLLAVQTVGLAQPTSARVAEICSRHGLQAHSHDDWDAFWRIAEVAAPGCLIAPLRADGDDLTVAAVRNVRGRTTLSVILLAEQASTRSVVQALRLGATEVLDWPFEAESLEQAVQFACRYSQTLHAEAGKTLEASRRVAQLRREEREVLELMLRGKLNKNIAVTLGIAVRTVEARRKRIFTKLGTRSLAEIAILVNDARREPPRRPHFLDRPAVARHDSLPAPPRTSG